MMMIWLSVIVAGLLLLETSNAFLPVAQQRRLPVSLSSKKAGGSSSFVTPDDDCESGAPTDPLRRNVIIQGSIFGIIGSCSWLLGPSIASAAAAALQDSLDVDTFLRRGIDAGGNMGVSSQAGKSRPQTGVVLRDGSEISQDNMGNVLAEILVGSKADPKAVLATFSSPWPLMRGPVFDVECRDAQTGDGAFLAVTTPTRGKSLEDLPSSFFLDRLFGPTGRFSFYGPPTDVKVKSSKMQGNNRYIELSFSNLSQSTNAEIPRRAVLVATKPDNSDNAVMLVGSATSTRWRRGAEAAVRQTVESFRATSAPKTNLKLRAKDRGAGSIDL